ncbi:hypothetical protein K469DRAFT_777604 [Zopfia rhizophila CBS 207.26]|uniref:Uncharacterized protein n=1 Tax=Zopfia rhizophila CBS 207.26 TaxID=1314779 RepID=A0A6A6E573_9PEZI|nr:hypothetical protein K469DRAFT_777604 [Zopfia rhizophila CBS 207.26]
MSNLQIVNPATTGGSKLPLSTTQKTKSGCANGSLSRFFQVLGKKIPRCGRQFERSAAKGWKKWTHKYQTCGAGVMGFMHDWEPLINIIKKGGGGYGDMAVGTFSALFVVRACESMTEWVNSKNIRKVAQFKEQSEGYLSSALPDIRDAMIGFALYEDIFRQSNELEDDFRGEIIDAYARFVTLAVESTKYYKGGGRKRWLSTILEPRKFQEMADDELKDEIKKSQYYCWLSPLLLGLIDERQKKGEFYAYHLLPVKGVASLRNIILSLLSQILRFESHKLRNEDVCQNLEALERKAAQNASKYDLDESLKELSLRVVNLFEQPETIFLFLDRRDRCEEDG